MHIVAAANTQPRITNSFTSSFCAAITLTLPVASRYFTPSVGCVVR